MNSGLRLPPNSNWANGGNLDGDLFSAQRMNWPKYYGVWPDHTASERRIAAEAFNARDLDSLFALYEPNDRPE